MDASAKTDRLADELELRNLVARYADAVNRRAADDWAATWAEEGVWHLFGRDVEGRTAVVETWLGAMGFFASVVQLIHSGTLEIDGDRATGRWYLSEVGQTAKGDRIFTVGVYHDECERKDGRWLFTRRRFDALYQGPPDLSGPMSPVPDLSAAHPAKPDLSAAHPAKPGKGD